VGTRTTRALEAALLFLGKSPEEARARLSDILVEEVSFVDRAANRRRFLIVKRRGGAMTKADVLDGNETEKAEWSTAYVNDLPDSAFLYIESGGEKDDEGKTTPRSLRHFPVRDADGKLDADHLCNAISRIPQSTAGGLTPEKMDQLQERARSLLAEAEKSSGPGLIGAVTAALEELVDVSGAAVAAKESPPPDVVQRVESISALLHDAVSRYHQPVSGGQTDVAKVDGDAADVLIEVGVGASALADTARGGDLGAAFITQLRQLAAKLNALAGQHPQPEGGDAQKSAEEETMSNETGESAQTETEETEAAVETGAEPETSETEVVEETKADDVEETEVVEETKADDVEETEITLEEMDNELVPMGSEVADKLKVLGEAMIQIAFVDNPGDLVKLRRELTALSKSVSAQVEKDDGGGKLAEVAELLRQATAVIDGKSTGGETAAAPPAAVESDAEKRAAETEVLTPDKDAGESIGVGRGPETDGRAMDTSQDGIADVLKQLAVVTKRMNELAGTPEAPASRTDPTTAESSSGQEPRREGRGGPWVL